MIVRVQNVPLTIENSEVTSGHPKRVFFVELMVIQGSKFSFGFGSTCATRCKFLGTLPKF